MQGLNLDGDGESDDELYISVYQFGGEASSRSRITIPRVHLGTGEVLAEFIRDRGWEYSVIFGKLFEEDRDAIVIEIMDPTSNYSAVEIYAFEVYTDSDVGAEWLIPKLNTNQDPLALAVSDIVPGTEGVEEFEVRSSIIKGTEIVDIEGLPRQGIKVLLNNTNDINNPISKILYWMEDGWTFVEK